MTKFQHFVGIDVSKKQLDIVLVTESGTIKEYYKTANTIQGIGRLLKWLSTRCELSNALFCMEDTGLYSRIVATQLTFNNCALWLENPVRIKRSSGMLRGKSDAADAAMIAAYAQAHQNKAILWQPGDEKLQQLGDLLALRERLITVIKMLRVPVAEMKSVGLAREASIIDSGCMQSIQALQDDLKQLDLKIDQLVQADKEWQRKIQLASSVKGVGRVTTLHLLFHTKAFTIITDPRKLACYCGVAPFQHTSGSSVRGKTRVSHFANMTLKKLLHLAAMSAISTTGELRDFFLRKVAQGKQKMSALNAVRNKIIHRICAALRKNQKYSPIPIA